MLKSVPKQTYTLLNVCEVLKYIDKARTAVSQSELTENVKGLTSEHLQEMERDFIRKEDRQGEAFYNINEKILPLLHFPLRRQSILTNLL